MDPDKVNLLNVLGTSATNEIVRKITKQNLEEIQNKLSKPTNKYWSNQDKVHQDLKDRMNVPLVPEIR